MRILSFVLSLCLTLNVLAASGTVSELEKALDDYQYGITVEWDQKDSKVHEAYTKSFLEKMSSLMTEQGLTKEEILQLAEKKMANKEAFEALKLKMSLMGKVNSPDELAKSLKELSKDMYGQGANWNGSGQATSWVLMAAVLIGFIYVLTRPTDKCVEYEEQEVCSQYEVCLWYHFSLEEPNTHCGEWSYPTLCRMSDVCVRRESELQ